MHTPLMQWSRGLYLAGLVLALVVVVPLSAFPFQLSKVAAFAACLCVCAVLFAASGGARELLKSHGLYLALGAALLPLAYVVSWWFSVDRSVGLTGYAVEMDTVLFAALVFLAFIFSFVHFRTLRTARILVVALTAAAAVAALFQAVSIATGGAIPLETFTNPASNLVGKWNDLGLLLGLLLVLLLVRGSLGGASSMLVRTARAAAIAVLLVLLALINFEVAWWLVLVCGLALALVAFLSGRSESSQDDSASPHRGVHLPLAAVAAAVLFLVWGAAFNQAATSVFPVSSLEVRPSYSTTMDVLNAARERSIARFAVGTGPNTFGMHWLRNKPAEVNQSQFWNLDFNVGYSTLATAFGTVGVLGALAWLVPVLLVAAAVLRALRKGLIGREDRAVVASLVMGVLFLAGALILYVPSGNLLLALGALAGATFGFLWRQGRSAETSPATPFGWSAAFAVVLVLVGLSAWAGAATVRRLAAESIAGFGSGALALGEIDKARAYAAQSLKVEETANGLRFAATAGAAKLQALASDTTGEPSQLQAQFSTALDETLSAALRAQEKNPSDYRPAFALAQVYTFLSRLKIEGAAAQARVRYVQAAELDPTGPHIVLAHARFEAEQGDAAEVERLLRNALTLKPNYTDAMLLVTQLAVANNDLATALQAAQAAVQSAPGIPSLWFQLGLLLYTGGDTQNAVAVLERALVLSPDYANARYFLGLSYYAEDRAAEGIAQFERLAETNPDNAEVALILANMRAGDEPFEGATPPATTPPESRPTAPVSQ